LKPSIHQENIQWDLHGMERIFGIQTTMQERYTNSIHPATIAFYLRKMKQADIIEIIPIKNGVISKDTMPKIIQRPQKSSEIIYSLKNPRAIYDLLIKHRENLLDEQIITTVLKHMEFFCSEGAPEKIQSPDDTIDSVVSTFNRFFFPPSFCS